MKSLIVSAVIFFAACLPMSAQECGAYDGLIDVIKKHGGQLEFRAASEKRYFVEVWVSEKEFIIISTIDGLACIMDSGFLLGTRT